MQDVITDLAAVQAGAEQFPGGRVQPLQVQSQAAHPLVADLHGGEVAVVDQRRDS
jgi:hypothetical protein